MKPLLLPLLAATALAGTEARTDYTADRALHLVATLELSMEAPDSRMTVDGEEREGFGGGGASTELRTLEETYRVLAHADGAPTRVRRAFGEMTKATTAEGRDGLVESEAEGALAHVTLEVALDDEEITVEVTDGAEPEQESALAGHALELAFDGLLPEGEVDEGATWDLTSEAILRALALDLEDAYFPRVPREERPEGEGRGGRGGRGGSPRGSSALRDLATAEWEGEATYAGTVEHDGLECLEIAVTFEAEGELPEMQVGGRRGRGGRAVGLAGAAPRVVENTITAELEGRLLFSVAEGRPVLFEVEGRVSTVRNNEFDRGESTMTMYNAQEGELSYTVEISVEPGDDE